MPAVNLGALNKAVSPTVANIIPKIAIINALAIWPFPAKAAMADKPSTINAKYSDE